jgi:hypothetical protein
MSRSHEAKDTGLTLGWAFTWDSIWFSPTCLAEWPPASVEISLQHDRMA